MTDTDLDPSVLAMLMMLHDAGGSIPARQMKDVPADTKQKARLLRLARHEAGSWYLSGTGREVVAGLVAEPSEMRPCPGPFGGPGAGRAY